MTIRDIIAPIEAFAPLSLQESYDNAGLVVGRLDDELQGGVLLAVDVTEKVVEEELYIKSVRLARADSAAEAKKILEAEGYIFLDANLNAGTGEDGIWLGYQTTTGQYLSPVSDADQ